MHTLKVCVIGANGQIGKKVVQILLDHEDHSVKAMVRASEQAREWEKQGVEAVVANLEGTVKEIAEGIKGCDAVIFTAGSGGHTGPDKTLLVDLDGAVKSMEAAEQAGVSRYIMVSALQAHNRENWNEKIRPYYVAKHYADRLLMESSLNYTIIRPGGLLNEVGTGKVAVSENLERSTIPREDVARTIVAAINHPNTYKRAFDIISGDDDIEKTLNEL